MFKMTIICLVKIMSLFLKVGGTFNAEVEYASEKQNRH